MITYETKTYLGDGVFVQRDSYNRLILSTEDGMDISNQIYLEPEVLAAFDQYRQLLTTFDKRCEDFLSGKSAQLRSLSEAESERRNRRHD